VTHPLGAEFVADPHPLFTRLRRDAPVWQVPDTPLFLVTTWHLVNEAAARVDDFSNRFRHTLYLQDDGSLGVVDNGDDGATDVFAGTDPPDHGAHRAIFFPELVQKRLAHLEPDVLARADALLDATLDAPSFDVAASLANPLPLQVMSDRVIGFSGADPADLKRWVLDGSRLVSGRLRLDEMAAAAEAVAGLWPWVDAQLADALDAPGRGGVLDAAATGVREGVLTRAQASFTLMILLGAGGETTTSLIGNTIRVLAERPALQAEVRAHPELVPLVLEETLRYESPFRFHPRLAVGPTTLGDVTVPDRAMVALCWSSANRDEHEFVRPNEFDIERPNPRHHMGFGRGIHFCVGAPLARLEGRVVVTRLLERTREFALDPRDPPQWVDSVWIRRHERLPIVVEHASRAPTGLSDEG
jgi:cytochrome P450